MRGCAKRPAEERHSLRDGPAQPLNQRCMRLLGRPTALPPFEGKNRQGLMVETAQLLSADEPFRLNQVALRKAQDGRCTRPQDGLILRRMIR